MLMNLILKQETTATANSSRSDTLKEVIGGSDKIIIYYVLALSAQTRKAVKDAWFKLVKK